MLSPYPTQDSSDMGLSSDESHLTDAKHTVSLLTDLFKVTRMFKLYGYASIVDYLCTLHMFRLASIVSIFFFISLGQHNFIAYIHYISKGVVKPKIISNN